MSRQAIFFIGLEDVGVVTAQHKRTRQSIRFVLFFSGKLFKRVLLGCGQLFAFANALNQGIQNQKRVSPEYLH